jgi:cell division protein FtsI/penicillin-binding protein 2
MRMIDRRLGLLFCGFLALLSLALVRSFWLQGVKGSSYKAEAHNQQTDTVTVPGLRGKITDRNGKVLAVSENAVNVIATPYQVTDPVTTAQTIAQLTDEPQADLVEALSDRESGYAILARKVDIGVADQIRDLKLPGIYTLPDSRRLYPQGELASQVIGAVGTENDGLTGLEQAEEDVVGGEDGEEEVVYDGQGDPIRLDTVKASQSGEDIQVTLDAAIQDKAEEALQSAGETWGAKGASAVVMDPKTGDILAMANWPGYDPRHLEDASEDALLNRPTGFTYEPGSTFKAFTVAAALEDGVVTPSSSFHLPSTIKVADREIEEAHARPPIDATVAQILAMSSNVGAVTIGLEVGADSFSDWISKFGFGEPTGVQFPAEERGIVPARDDYSGSTMGNLPIGQGLAVTPLQMAAGYAAIANGGILRTPRLISQLGDEAVDRDVEGERVMSTRTAAQLRTMLEGVLEPGGTASSVEVPGYVLAGKTGTAEKAEDGGYSETRYVASFVGFAPAQNPRLLVAVVVDEPAYEHAGGAVAAPVFGDIAEFALPYLGIAPN